jgi:hypothetical protein
MSTNGSEVGNALVRRADEAVQIQGAFSSGEAFDNAQRIAKALASSTIVPKDYIGNIPNVLVAMELANRIGASVFAVMQNMDVIHGRPGLRATFVIATVNASGRFSPIRFRFEGEEGADDWGCRAVAVDRESGEECIGALITIKLAKAEGWYTRNGTKWKTMPEQMLMYRAAAWWSRVFCPERTLGMHTTDELDDFSDVQRGAPSNGTRNLNELLTATEVADEPKAEPATDGAVAVAAQLYQHTLHRRRPDLLESDFDRRGWLASVLDGRSDEDAFTVADYRRAIVALEAGEGPAREPGEDDE